MPTSPPEPIDWSFHLQWMSQRMVDQDARMKKISAERSNSLGDQMAQSASLQQLLKAGSASRLSAAMDQALEVMDVRACDWRGKPHEDDLPMLGLHPTKGLCWVTAEGAEPDFWSCRTPWGTDERPFTDHGWLFTAIEPNAPPPLNANTWTLAWRLMHNHPRPLIELGVVTLIFNAMAWGCGAFLMQRYPQALQQFGLYELMLLTAVIAFSIDRKTHV